MGEGVGEAVRVYEVWSDLTLAKARVWGVMHCWRLEVKVHKYKRKMIEWDRVYSIPITMLTKYKIVDMYILRGKKLDTFMETSGDRT